MEILELARKAKLINIFYDYAYEVPYLQRSYVWKEKHILDLLDDIYDAKINNLSEYFIGSMVFSKSEIDNVLQIIDGQQRLITLSMLLSAIREKLEFLIQKTSNEEKEEYNQALNDIKSFLFKPKWRFKQDIIINLNSEEKFLFENILRGSKSNLKANKSKLYKGYVIIKDWINRTFEEPKELKSFLYFVLNNTYAIQTIIRDISYAYIIFEVLNARGTPLEPEDLIKNMVLLELKRKGATNKDIIKFQENWKYMTLNIKPEKISNFLKYYIMSSGKYINKKDIYLWFKNSVRAKSIEEIIRLSTELLTLSTYYRSMTEGTFNNFQKFINKFNFKQPRIVLLATLSKLDVNNPQERRKIEQISELLEKISFCYKLTGKKTNSLERNFCKISKLIRENELKEAEQKLKKLLLDTREEVQTKLETFHINGKNDSFIAKYILSKVANLMDNNTYNPLENSWTLEHIRPQKGNGKNGWSKLKKEEHINLVNMLGNLTLLSLNRNSASGIKSFEEKKEIYKNSSCMLTKLLVEDSPKTGTKNTKYDKWIKKYVNTIKKLGYSYPPLSWDKQKVEARQKTITFLFCESYFS